MRARFWLSHQDLAGNEKQRDTLMSSPSSSGQVGTVKEHPECAVMHKWSTQGTLFNNDTATSPKRLPFSICNSGHEFWREDLRL